MAESHIDCNACSNMSICKYVANIQAIASIATGLSFHCQYSSSRKADTIVAAKDSFPEMSVDELSRLHQQKTAEKSREAKDKGFIGTCARCGKEDVICHSCSACGETYCESCMETSTTIDPITGSTVEEILCKECSEEADEY